MLKGRLSALLGFRLRRHRLCRSFTGRRNPDALLKATSLPDPLCKTGSPFGRNLEPGFIGLDADHADIAFCHATGIADHRQQEFRIGAGLAPDRDGEPDTVLHVRAARHYQID